MGNGVTQCGWRHAPEVRWGFWEILKKSVSWELDTERDGWRLLARGDLCGGCHTCLGRGRWKSQYRKIVPLSWSRRTFKLKGNKMVRTWTEKSLRFFRISRSYILCIYVMNVPCTFRIFVYMAMVQYIFIRTMAIKQKVTFSEVFSSEPLESSLPIS